MESVEQPAATRHQGGAELCGVHGWLMFFVVVFFLNSLNLFSMPFTVSLINWRAVWEHDAAAALYMASSSLVEYLAAIATLVAAVLILMRRRIALVAVNAYCALLGVQALGGLLLTQSIVELVQDSIPIVSSARFSLEVSRFFRIDLDQFLLFSLYFSFSAVLAVAVVVFLYFLLSRRVKATLKQA